MKYVEIGRQPPPSNYDEKVSALLDSMSRHVVVWENDREIIYRAAKLLLDDAEGVTFYRQDRDRRVDYTAAEIIFAYENNVPFN